MFCLTGGLGRGYFEFRVAGDGAWAVNCVSDGAQDGPNYARGVPADGTVNFVYDPETQLVETTIE